MKLYADLDRAISVGDIGLHATATADPVPVDDHIALGNALEKKKPCRDVYVHVGEGCLRWYVSPDRVGSESGQGLINAEKDFVGGSTEE